MTKLLNHTINGSKWIVSIKKFAFHFWNFISWNTSDSAVLFRSQVMIFFFIVQELFMTNDLVTFFYYGILWFWWCCFGKLLLHLGIFQGILQLHHSCQCGYCYPFQMIDHVEHIKQIFSSSVNNIIQKNVFNLWFGFMYIFSFCFGHTYSWEYCRKWSVHWTSICLFIKQWNKHESFCS